VLRASRITVESSDRKAGDKSAGGVLLVDSFKFRDGGSHWLGRASTYYTN